MANMRGRPASNPSGVTVRCARCAARRPDRTAPALAVMSHLGEDGWEVARAERQGSRGAERPMPGVVGVDRTGASRTTFQTSRARPRPHRGTPDPADPSTWAPLPPPQTGRVRCRTCKRRLPVGLDRLSREADRARAEGRQEFYA